MAKESKSPAGETILEQQKRGVNTVSSMAQVGVGLAAFAVALTGFPVYLAAPIASGVGVAGNIATNYLVSNSIGRGKEKGIIARLAGAAALQSDRLATYLPRTQYREDKKDPEKAEALSKLQDKGGTGLFYVGGALTLASVAADVAKSFFPIPIPPITTTLLPIALAGMMACDSFAAGSKEALKDTIVGDAQEALGAIAKRTNQISRQAVQNHIQNFTKDLTNMYKGNPSYSTNGQGTQAVNEINSSQTQESVGNKINETITTINESVNLNNTFNLNVGGNLILNEASGMCGKFSQEIQVSILSNSIVTSAFTTALKGADLNSLMPPLIPPLPSSLISSRI
jgi:hypothetical protein